jgi:hypothetical protein
MEMRFVWALGAVLGCFLSVVAADDKEGSGEWAPCTVAGDCSGENTRHFTCAARISDSTVRLPFLLPATLAESETVERNLVSAPCGSRRKDFIVDSPIIALCS